MQIKSSSYFKTTRFRITLWYSALFLIMEIMIGLAIYLYLNKNLNTSFDYSLKRQAETIYNLVSENKAGLADFKADSIYSSQEDLIYDIIFETLAFNPRNTFVQVKYKKGILFSTENLRGRILPDIGANNKMTLYTFEDRELCGQKIRGAFLNRGAYRIIVAFPSALIEEPMALLENIFIIMFPVSFVISILAGALLSAGSLYRINSIIRETEEITALNLDKSIEGGEFDDEYGRLVRTMNDMIARIKTSVDYMNQFSISASHELRTPLTILRGEIEVALRSPKSAAQYQEILKSNFEETLRLINITENLFLISRFDNMLVQLEKQSVNINDFLNEVAGHFNSGEDLKGVEVSLFTGPGTKIDLDIRWMKQALFNLIWNAKQYGDCNYPVIIKSEKYGDGEIKISVINNGSGISAEALPRIFDRFFREESSRNRNTGGAGLGLSLVKSIISWHGSEINVSSVPGGQTEFFFTMKSYV